MGTHDVHPHDYHALDLEPGKVLYETKYVWELPVRLTHWAIAASIAILFATGLMISSPVVGPSGEAYNNFFMGRVREIHFIAGYVFLFALLIRAYWFFAGNNYARSGFPRFWQKDWWAEVFEQMREYVGITRGPVQLGHNALAGASYFLFVWCLGFFQIATGFALYGETNPGGFWDTTLGWVRPLLGGSFATHVWHHTVTWAFPIFVLLHLYIVLMDVARFKNGLLGSMTAGFKFYRKGDLDHDRWLT